MPRVKANGIELEYDTVGDPADPALVLVMGLGAQLIDWPAAFAGRLADGGFHVIRYDNRDAGLSTHLDDLPKADFGALLAGTGTAPYALADLSDDLAGLLDALNIERAHVVGASMGGMIAQRFAIDHPHRLLSLCSIMSSTGDLSVGRPTPAAQAMLLRPPATSRDQAIEQGVAGYRLIASTGFAVTDEELRERVTADYDRAYHPAGTGRQLAAVLTTPDRTAALGAVAVPTLVVHGEVDPLIDRSGGAATAAAIPGAELLMIPGMGHDLPAGVWPELVAAITANAARAR